MQVAEQRRSTIRELREAQMLSKAELARRAGVSPLTIDRIEKGKPCRMDTKRKIILALGLKLSDRVEVFGEGQ
ncbi:MAG: helix-turn-helix transcriptional regulator [bacterium]